MHGSRRTWGPRRFCGVSTSMSWSAAILPAVEHQHAVGEHDRLVDVVGDQQHRRPVPVAQAAEQRVHPDAGQRVERAERLVGEQQFGFAHQGSGQRDALLLAAGQLVRPRPLASGETRPRRGCRGRVPPRRARSSPRMTLSSTRCQGSSRESWNTTDDRSGHVDAARCPPRRRRDRPARAAACSCPSRCCPSSATNSPARDLEVQAVQDGPVAVGTRQLARSVRPARRRSVRQGASP